MAKNESSTVDAREKKTGDRQTNTGLRRVEKKKMTKRVKKICNSNDYSLTSQDKNLRRELRLQNRNSRKGGKRLRRGRETDKLWFLDAIETSHKRFRRGKSAGLWHRFVHQSKAHGEEEKGGNRAKKRKRGSTEERRKRCRLFLAVKIGILGLHQPV